MIISGGELVSWLAGMLLHAVWIATVIALAAWAMLRQVRDPRTTHALALGGLLLIACGLAVAGIATWPKAAPASTWIPVVAPAVASTWQPRGHAPVITSLATPIDWRAYLVLAWSCGVLAMSLRHAVGWWRVMRLRRTASRIGGELAERFSALSHGAGVDVPLLLSSTRLAVPIAIGWWRPAVVMPASLLTGLPQAQLEALLLHELAHLRRQDWLVAVAASLLESLLFFHPAVWWLGRRLREARELCCDAQALHAGAEPEGLARALLSLAERLAPGGPALAATGGVLADRVRLILGLPERREQPWRALTAIIMLPLLLVIITACSTASPARHTPTAPLSYNLDSSGPQPAFPLARRIRANASGHFIRYDVRILSAPLAFWADHGLAGNQAQRLDAAMVERLRAAEGTDARVSCLSNPHMVAFPLQRATACMLTEYAYIQDYRLVQGRPDPDISVLTYGSAFESCAEPVEGGILLAEARASTVNLLGVESLTFTWPSDKKGETYPLEIPVVQVTEATLEPDTRLAIGETIAMPLASSVQQRGMPTFQPAIDHGTIINRVPDPDPKTELRQVFLLTVQLGDALPPRLSELRPAVWLDRSRIDLDLHDVSLDEAINRLATQLPVPVEVVRDADYAATRVSLTVHGETARVALARLLSQCLLDATASDTQLRLVSTSVKDMGQGGEPGSHTPQTTPSAPSGF